MRQLFQWFSGGENPYPPLPDALAHDSYWIALTLMLNLAVAAAMIFAVVRAMALIKTLPESLRAKFAGIRNVLVAVGVIPPLLLPLLFIWPGWRLYSLALMPVAYCAWYFAVSQGLSGLASHFIYAMQEAEQAKVREAAAHALVARLRDESLAAGATLNVLSHDLRTPLNGVMLQASLVRMATQQGDQATAQVTATEMESTIRAAADILNEMLKHTRLLAKPAPQPPF